MLVIRSSIQPLLFEQTLTEFRFFPFVPNTIHLPAHNATSLFPFNISSAYYSFLRIAFQYLISPVLKFSLFYANTILNSQQKIFFSKLFF